jgi:hypothetical protein
MDFIERILQPIRGWAMQRHIRLNQRAFVKRVERNPWTHEYRAVKAEVERTVTRRCSKTSSADSNRLGPSDIIRIKGNEMPFARGKP